MAIKDAITGFEDVAKAIINTLMDNKFIRVGASATEFLEAQKVAQKELAKHLKDSKKPKKEK